MFHENSVQVINRQAAIGAKWVFMSTVISRAFQLVVTVLLARLLSVEDFGLMGYAYIFMSLVALFQDLGIGQALIQRKENFEEAVNVAFITMLSLGVLWFIGTLLMAPSIAHFFGEPQIIPILQVMSLSFLIVPFGNVQKKLLSKELRFRKLFYLGLITTFVHGSVSVTLALCGFGVWSFVYGFLSAIIVDMLFVWRLLSWRPKWHYNMQIAKEMLGFGGTVSSEGILSWAVNTIDDVLVGKWLGGASLGMYRMGFKLGILPAKNITSPLLKVLFPAFSKLQEDRIELKRAFLKAMKHISVITFPMSVGIATTANLFIPLLLGEKWSPTVPIVQILALYGIFMSIGSLIPQAYKAIGRPDIYLKYVSVRSIFTLPVFYCVVPYGLVALSAAHLILTLIFFPVNFYIGLKVMSISFEEVYDSLKVSVTYSVCVLFLVVILEKFFLYSVHLSQGWTLGLLILSAVSLYCTLLYLSRKTFLEIKGLVLRTITG